MLVLFAILSPITSKSSLLSSGSSQIRYARGREALRSRVMESCMDNKTYIKVEGPTAGAGTRNIEGEQPSWRGEAELKAWPSKEAEHHERVQMALRMGNGRRTHRLPGYDRKTERLEVAAFLGVGLLAGSIIFLAAAEGMKFGAGEDAIASALSRSRGVFEMNGSVVTNVSASVPGSIAQPVGKRSVTPPRI